MTSRDLKKVASDVMKPAVVEFEINHRAQNPAYLVPFLDQQTDDQDDEVMVDAYQELALEQEEEDLSDLRDHQDRELDVEVHLMVHPIVRVNQEYLHQVESGVLQDDAGTG